MRIVSAALNAVQQVRQENAAYKRASVAQAVESAKKKHLDELTAIEPQLRSAVDIYADQAQAVRDLIADASATRAVAASSRNAGPRIPAIALVPLILEFGLPFAGRWWFGSEYRWWDYPLVGYGFAFSWITVLVFVAALRQRSRSWPLLVLRQIIFVAATAAAAVLAVRWRGEQPSIWEVVVIGLGLSAIPMERLAAVRNRPVSAAEAGVRLRQLLAYDFFELLVRLHDVSLADEPPPGELAVELEASARRVLGLTGRLADQQLSDYDERTWVREFGGSVAAGLRWHKRLVIFPSPHASADLFASLGYGLAAVAGQDWQRLMFEPAPSPGLSFWRRYRGRLGVTLALVAAIGATYAFPNALPGVGEVQLRGALALTAVLSLVSSSSETVSRVYDAVNSRLSRLRAAVTRLKRPSPRAASRSVLAAARGPTPGTLGVSGFLVCCGSCVLCVPWSLFLGGVRAWLLPACRGGDSARFHGPRSRAGRGGSSFLTACFPDGGLAEAGGEHGDLGFPGGGCLGRGGVLEFRAGFLRAS
jgi:hypothetical protein